MIAGLVIGNGEAGEKLETDIDDGGRRTPEHERGERTAPAEAAETTTNSEDMGRWALYDCSGLRAPLGNEKMQSLFH